METDPPGAAGSRRGARGSRNGTGAKVRQGCGRFLPVAAPRPCAQARGPRQDSAKTCRHQGTAQESRRKEKAGKAEEERRVACQAGNCRGSWASDSRKNTASPHGAGEIGSRTHIETETQIEEEISSTATLGF